MQEQQQQQSVSLVATFLSLVSASEALPQAGEDFEYFSNAHQDFVRKCQDMQHSAGELIHVLTSRQDLDTDAKVLAFTEKLRARADARLASTDRSLVTTTTTATTTTSSSREPTIPPPPTTLNNNNNKPQSTFHDYPIDNSRSPWIPKLPPPSHLVPLLPTAPSLDLPQNVHHHLVSTLGHTHVSAPNPFESAIRDAQHHIPTWLWDNTKHFLPSRSRKTKSQANTPFSFVTTDAEFTEMQTHLLDLDKHKAVAIDLEHHALRSFLGFTCLVQISTSSRDFVIDALKLRHRIPNLSPLFLCPHIVKVLHGADYDVEWLQKDFGLYICQLFDTGQAARLLGHASAGLAHALTRFCQVKANKQYQLSDWRTRPLPEEMLAYAREDTHYLLTIFDEMRLELIKAGQDGIRLVMSRSADIACRLYEKPLFDVKDAVDVIERASVQNISPRMLSDVQTRVLHALYEWRDMTARVNDESVHYVLSVRSLARLVRDLAHTTAKVLDDLDVDGEFARAHVAELVKVIDQALAERREGGGSGDDDDTMSITDEGTTTTVMERTRKRARTSTTTQEPVLDVCVNATLHVNAFEVEFPMPSVKASKTLVFPDIWSATSVLVNRNSTSAFFNVLHGKDGDVEGVKNREFGGTKRTVEDALVSEMKKRNVSFVVPVGDGDVKEASSPVAPPPLFHNETNFVSLSQDAMPVALRDRKTSKKDRGGSKKTEPSTITNEPVVTESTPTSSFVFSKELAESVGALVSTANAKVGATAPTTTTTTTKNPYLFKASKSSTLVTGSSVPTKKT